MEKDSEENLISKLNNEVKLLEQELTKMANRLGSLNQQVNDVVAYYLYYYFLIY